MAVNWLNYPGKYFKCTDKYRAKECPLEIEDEFKTKSSECCITCYIDCSERCNCIVPVNGTIHSACADRHMEIVEKIVDEKIKYADFYKILRILGIEE